MCVGVGQSAAWSNMSWLDILWKCLILLPLWSRTVFAQIGTQCTENKSCPPNQLCKFGYCQCELGYVKAETYCFPIKNYGDSCFFTEQCNDNRLECRFPNETYSAKLCLCDRYHKYSEEAQYCVPAVTLQALLEQEAMKHKTYDVIDRNAKYVFDGVVIAGIVAICLGFLFAALCVIYGCCIDRCVPPEGHKCSHCENQRNFRDTSDRKRKEWDQLVATMAIDDAGDII